MAVLYLETRSRDSSDVQLAASITEEMIEALGADPRLDVRSHFVSRTLARGDADPLTGARAQRLAWLVSGSLRATADSIELRIELSRVDSGRVAWTRRFPQARAEFAGGISTMTGLIAGRIAGRMLPDAQRAGRKHQPDPTAYLLLLRAKSLGRLYTDAGCREAAALVDRALAADSLYAEAWGYGAMMRMLWRDFIGEREDERARVMAERALTLDPDQPAALVAVAAHRAFTRRDYSAENEARARRAVTLAPGWLESRLSLAVIAVARDKRDEAIALSRGMVALDSLSPLAWEALWRRLQNARRYDEAIVAHDRVTQLDPSRVWTTRRTAIAGYRLRQGRCGESEAEARALADTVLLIRSLACLGKNDEARSLFYPRRMAGRANAELMTWALLAEPDSMFAAVDRLESQRRGGTAFELVTNPIYDKYRKDPRFVATVRHAGIELPP